MNDGIDIKQVSIKHRPGAYRVYRHMNNRVWYALAEFVDNSIQSYLDNKELLHRIEGPDYQLKVSIDVEPGNYIIIRDNAAGIDSINFRRAFEPANIPLDATGLSEFGMGMKIASIWLSDTYKVRSSAINEAKERTVIFNLITVIENEKEDLSVKNKDVNIEAHYTEVILEELSHNAPKNNPRQLAKIKDHLASIYRKFINKGELILIINGEELHYNKPEVLVVPSIDDPEGKPIEWIKEVGFEAGKYKVEGFIGLLKEMSQVHSGLSLFRRGRVIEGSHDEKYHPKILCGQPGSMRDKRLFGELELKGFDVSYEKGRFLGSENFDEFLKAIKIDLSKGNFNLLRQGDLYRKTRSVENIKQVAKGLAKELNKKKTNLAESLIEYETPVESNKKLEYSKSSRQSPVVEDDEKITIMFSDEELKYALELEFIRDKYVNQLYTIFPPTGNAKEKNIKSKINLSHSFFEKYDSIKNEKDYYPIVDIFAAFIISEIMAQSQGTKDGGKIRKNFNDIITKLNT